MKLLIVGSGGREHALAWKIKQSEYVKELYAAPGNGGILDVAECVNIPADDIRQLATFVEKKGIDLTIVGPEIPLSLGIVDYFNKRRLNIFGPSQAAARIESSKVFAKRFMRSYDIPTASFVTFDRVEDALEFVHSRDERLVVKADGLAAGKGTIIANNEEEAETAIKRMMIERFWGDAGKKIVIEKYLEGVEASVLAFTDGENVLPLLPVQDYKRAYDNNKGPNTGGMGSVSPHPVVDKNLLQEITDTILLPTISGLRREGNPFKGILYAGLIVQPDRSVKVIEFNCRFGDPETQAFIPLMKSDLIEVILYTIEERLDEAEVLWYDKKAVTVMLASGGYPKKYKKGFEITGLKEAADMESVHIFHSGTLRRNGAYITNGGRVLGVTAVGDNYNEAFNRSYRAVDMINFERMTYRTDIGLEFIKGGV